MQTFVLSRLGQMLLTIFIVSLIVFFLVRLKGDPISVMAPPTFSESQVEALRKAWGFDRPLVEQYLIFVRKAITGDFGLSVQARIPAMELVLKRLLNTYLLAGVSALIGLIIAIPLGVISALRRNSWLDITATTAATLGTAMPNFWLGLMLSDGRQYIGSAWWMSTFPGIAITLTVLGVVFVGDWLRDLLDPRLQGR